MNAAWQISIHHPWAWREVTDSGRGATGVQFHHMLRPVSSARTIFFTGNFWAAFRWAAMTHSEFFHFYQRNRAEDDHDEA